MKFCTTCGAPLKEGASFCTSCGAPVKNVGMPAMQSRPGRNAAGPNIPPVTPPYMDYPPYSQPSEPAGIFQIYEKAFSVLMKKPFRLWGISLLSGLIIFFLKLLFGLTIGIAMCLDILITVGMTMVYLHGYRGEEVHSVQLFDAFKDGATIKRVLGGMAWMNLWIFIWALVPIAGPFIAIVRTYQYRLTPYILVTEPNIRATEAIHISSQRTEGWKLKMFGADFLVYVIIGAAYLLLSLLSNIPYFGVVFVLFSLLLSLAVALFVKLFTGLVKAAFYEEITRRR